MLAFAGSPELHLCVCLTGPERGPHAVAEVAGEELWSGITCCQGQPDGHALLVVSGLTSVLFLYELWAEKPRTPDDCFSGCARGEACRDERL